MRYSKLMLAAAVLGVFGTQMAGATPTAEEVAQLGKTLTPFGAIKAGNKEGTIPEWTGGICTPPAGYKPFKGLSVGGAPIIDPFAADKPLFKITAADVAKYADKLDEGNMELFKRYPQTYSINVYPTRRSACFPDYVYENTIKRVMNPKIVGMDTAPSITGAHAQIPFPIPKTGNEVMWNTLLKFVWPNNLNQYSSWMVDSSGNMIHQNTQNITQSKPYWDNSLTMLPDDKPYWSLISKVTEPAGISGTLQLRLQFLRPDLRQGSSTWQYIPGQRRVRIAPEFSYDGVSITSAGLVLFDEINGFDGKQDRFDFKLIGRKEMYIPYNDYTLANGGGEVNKPNHIDPNALRWELHRVWMVEATLKPGERHVEKKKVFYIDEDSWNIIILNGIDKSNSIFHLSMYPPIQMYDKPELLSQEQILYDMSRRAYLHATHAYGIGAKGEKQNGVIKMPPYPPGYFTPDSMAGAGLR